MPQTKKGNQWYFGMHGEEQRAGADAGYTGVEKRAEIEALGRGLEWRVAARRSTIKAQPEGWAKAIGGAWEKLKARARALVEHYPLTRPNG